MSRTTEPARREVRVVLLEDRQMVAESLTMALEATGGVLVVGVAELGGAASERVARWRPDVVVVGQADHEDCLCGVVTALRRSGSGPVVVRLMEVESTSPCGHDDAAGLAGDVRLSTGVSGAEVRDAVLRAGAGPR